MGNDVPGGRDKVSSAGISPRLQTDAASGVDAPAEKIIGKALEVDAQIIGMSALLTTTMVRQREVIEELDKEGLRPRIRVLVGGAPITKDWAEKIKADGTSEDAVGAVKLAKQLLGKE